MKTSLLLAGLVMGIACVGTAQATDLNTHPTIPTMDSQAPVAMVTSGHGVLSDLNHLLSGTTSTADAAPTDTHASRSASGKSASHQPPGPTSMSTATRHRQVPSSSANTTAPPATSGSNTDVPSVETTHPSLGWQSLLPGSIQ